ncbi:MAG TPA: class I SAM-dependent methyltransferase [Pseudonocardia sp.]|jgi:SAM-dependent methyltransferase|nr:class I SAM-dependent methyltransferase [Pseudonocardia sp.]
MADHQQTPPADDPAEPGADWVARGRTFGAVASAYAAHRPDYPDAALDWALAPLGQLDTGAGPVLLDLAAGTGKLTASLVGRSAQVTAVEPDPEMLAVLHAALPQVTALAGSAEDIPLPAASVDAVLVGQAFHWFDPERAGAEIARVLRPGGVLAALWNADDNSVDWVAGYHRAATRERAVPGVPTGRDREDLPGATAFSPTERTEFPHHQRLTVEGLIEVLATHSWALISTPEQRDAAFDRVRSYFASRPELVTGSDGSFELPLRTAVFRTLRVAERR